MNSLTRLSTREEFFDLVVLDELRLTADTTISSLFTFTCSNFRDVKMTLSVSEIFGTWLDDIHLSKGRHLFLVNGMKALPSCEITLDLETLVRKTKYAWRRYMTL
jgi:hypothetical protein